MEYRPFGSTGLSVSAMGFGTWPMCGDRYGPIDDGEAIRAIHRALDAGVNCLDTAPAYGVGHSEAVVGRALKGRRHEVILVTKCGIRWDPELRAMRRDTSRAGIMAEIDASLRRLGTDHVDVYLIHWPNAATPFEEAFATMDEVVKAGKARFVGLSNFTVEQMHRCMSVRRVDVIQVGYHLYDRRMEREVFPFCREHGIGVMGYGSLAHGLLTGSFSHETAFDPNDWRATGIAFGQPIFQPANLRRNVDVARRLEAEVATPAGLPMTHLALAWALRQPAISTALVGARTPAEVDANLASVSSRLSDADAARAEAIMADAAGLIDVFTPLKGSNELWVDEASAGPVARN